MLVRDYRGNFQKEFNSLLLWLPLMIYGLVGVFIRPFLDYFGVVLKNRKSIIYIALFLELVTFLPITIIQNEATSTIQALGIGIGASMIGTYELMFKEQYGKSQSYLTVSILAFPPIIADFASGPFQAIVEAYAKSDQNLYIERMTILWIVAICVIPITFLLTVIIKEDRNKVGLIYENKVLKKNNHGILLFILVLIIGMIITYIKFANSGAVGKAQLVNLFKFNNLTNHASLNAYLSTIFTVGQIIGTFGFSFMSYKKVNKNIIFSFGISIWIIYHFISLFIFNPYVFLSIHVFNGIAYGLLYNVILGYVLSLSFKTRKITPMGIYQSVAAIGITTSNWFNTYLKENVFKSNNFDNFKTSVFVVDAIILVLLVILCVLYFINYYFSDRIKKKIINYI